MFQYGPYGFSSSYAMKLKKGGSFGDIYGKAFKRDTDGKILYETDGERQGLPMIEGDGNTVKVGNANPGFHAGMDECFLMEGTGVEFAGGWSVQGKSVVADTGRHGYVRGDKSYRGCTGQGVRDTGRREDY